MLCRSSRILSLIDTAYVSTYTLWFGRMTMLPAFLFFFPNATLCYCNSHCVDDNQETLGNWLFCDWQLLQMRSRWCWNVVMSRIPECLRLNMPPFMWKSRNGPLKIPDLCVDTAKIVLRLKDDLLLWNIKSVFNGVINIEREASGMNWRWNYKQKFGLGKLWLKIMCELIK